tara:strand:+ start:392 stop:532 length:141 start_codon:yes stop_codon:yes gene_type:complete
MGNEGEDDVCFPVIFINLLKNLTKHLDDLVIFFCLSLAQVFLNVIA